MDTCPSCDKEFLPDNGIEQMCPTKGCDSGVKSVEIKHKEIIRLVSYDPANYTTCTLNIDGEEFYYELAGTTKK